MSAHRSPPKRPRLSLQIKAAPSAPSVRTSRTLSAIVNPQSPTAFNTLSNVYSTVIDRSAPVPTEPLTAINTKERPTLSRLQTQYAGKEIRDPTPFTASYPETPLTAQPTSPSVPMEINFPSTMTATPPLSAGPIDPAGPRVFSFSPIELTAQRLGNSSPRTFRRRTNLAAGSMTRPPPYTHTRSLHSILRNSPLPPRTAQTPISPRRQSLRLQEKAARRVGYTSPLTQTITTNKYTRSHIDLLFDELSPYSPANKQEDPEIQLDLAMAYTGDETRDGGQTPGPFEEMRRRMAGLAASTPVSAAPSSAGIRKRKRKDRKRRWVWTIGQEEDDANISGALAAVKAVESATAAPVTQTPMFPVGMSATVPEIPEAEILTPSIESCDVEMSDMCSVASDTTDRP